MIIHETTKPVNLKKALREMRRSSSGVRKEAYILRRLGRAIRVGVDLREPFSPQISVNTKGHFGLGSYKVTCAVQDFELGEMYSFDRSS